MKIEKYQGADGILVCQQRPGFYPIHIHIMFPRLFAMPNTITTTKVMNTVRPTND